MHNHLPVAGIFPRILVIGTLLSTLPLTITVRHDRKVLIAQNGAQHVAATVSRNKRFHRSRPASRVLRGRLLLVAASIENLLCVE